MADAPPHRPASPPAAPCDAVRPLRILIVDDLEDNREIVVRLLRQTPHQTAVAGDGAEAVRRVQTDAPYDLVLMDVQMPVMDGLQAVRVIRAWEQTTGRVPLRILALTANAEASHRDEALAAGCDAHLAKPFRRADLYEAVSRLVPPVRPAA